jgi:uncharacterized protein (TIGR03437 family)
MLAVANAQTQGPALAGLRPDWRRIGSPVYEIGLAGAAGGPVDRVWFSDSGARLLARTVSGRVYEETGAGEWKVAGREVAEASADFRYAGRLPEPEAVVRSADSFHARLYAFGRHVYRSDDGGGHWTNLTAFRGRSIIGEGITALAVSPADPEVIVAANAFGVWRSADGGLSWAGLNDALPNLPVRRILDVPSGTQGTRIALADGRVLEWAPGENEAWRPAVEAAGGDEAVRRKASLALDADIAALALSDGFSYAGSADGRLWASADGGRSWYPVRDGGERLLALASPRRESTVVFLAVSAAGEGGAGARLLRSSDAGATWEDVTGGLAAGLVQGLAVDETGAALYVASTGGLFFRMLDRPGGGWISLLAGVQAAVADVKLDAAGHQVFAALEGYGVMAAPAPHRLFNVQVVNAADFSSRPAAPGSLLTVLGGRLLRARAGLLAAPVLHAGEMEAQIQLPFEVEGTSAQIALEMARGAVTVRVPLDEVSPAIFVDRDGGALLLDSASGTLVDRSNPARGGSRVQILATGLGRVTPRWPAGMAAPAEGPPKGDAAVAAFLDGSPVGVTRATLAPSYIGFYLVEIELPAIVNGGAAELYLTAAGRESNRVRIDLEP